MLGLFRTRAAVLLTLIVAVFGGLWNKAQAASLIRDAEVENTIRAYATPLFEAAGLRPQDIDIFVIGDPTLNAFVAGGQNLFVNTGFLIKTRDASEVIGVIAHETGHIAGGHLARFSSRINTSSNVALVTTLLGLLTAIASGSGEAGVAVSQAGQGLALGNLLAYSRTQESSADQAGLGLLDRTGQSAKGLASFLRTIENQEFLSPNNQDPYVRTHPVTRERVRQVEQHLKKSQYSGTKPSPQLEEMHRRMVAKLVAFTDYPETVFNRYPESDRSVAARYARAIAYYRIPDLGKALPLVDGLIRDEPKNPYFHELKGQILFENGRIAESLAPNREAVRLLPDSALLRLGLARSQIERNDPALNKEAVENLLFTTQAEPYYAFGWDQLAIAYGRDGQLGMSALAQAEGALVRGRKKDALSHAARAEKRLDKGSAAWLRLQDIKRVAKEKDTR
ncbi:MAG: M48 family metalloprotease [Alphaproteobacteria bacterium]|nr:M48 family metalloprotease [Alphaproteobacteria bacterium]